MTATVEESPTLTGPRRWPWVEFAARRALRFLVSLWVLLTASFLMIHLIPGDPVRLALGRSAPLETVLLRRQELGLDEPLLTQYLDFFKGLFTGDLGVSMISGLPVAQIIGDRLPASLELAAAAFVVIVLLSVPIGTLMAIVTRGGRRPRAELTFATSTIIVAAVPSFLIATALITVFAVALGWLPPAGEGELRHLVLPTLALSIGPIAILSRILRIELLDVLDKDFVRTARAKRLPNWRIYLKHALPNASTATLTLGGLILSSLVVGTVLIETVFAWPGLGSSIVSAIQQKDFPLVQAIVLVYGAIVLIVNLIVDVILAVLDPRSIIRGA